MRPALRKARQQGTQALLLCWCCCGVQLIAGAPAIYFGYLAIRNNEPEREKAYIAIGIGVLDMIGFLILMIAVIRSN